MTELAAMHNSGITTYVIGFGDIVDQPEAITQLENMAGWGSGGTENYFDANNQEQLEAALAAIVAKLEFDPCCAYDYCAPPPPLPPDPDPIPPQGDGDGDGDPPQGDGDGDPPPGDGDGDVDPPLGDGDGDDDPTTDPMTGDGDTDTSADSDTDGGETGTGDEVGADEVGGDEGCSCTTSGSDTEKSGGLPGALFALGLVGFVRRRRRDSLRMLRPSWPK